MENKNKNNSIKKQIRKVWLPLILLFLLLINLSFLPNIFTILNNNDIKLQPLLGINDDINLLSNHFNIENNNEINENELNTAFYIILRKFIKDYIKHLKVQN